VATSTRGVLLDRRGHGTPADIAHMAHILASAVRTGESFATTESRQYCVRPISAVNISLAVPLASRDRVHCPAACEDEKIHQEEIAFAPGGRARPLLRRTELAAQAVTLRCPFQAIAIGALRIYCTARRGLLPIWPPTFGEHFPNLITAGLRQRQYRATCRRAMHLTIPATTPPTAPHSSLTFPFAADIEAQVLDACKAALSAL